jgi:hypothetical protein
MPRRDSRIVYYACFPQGNRILHVQHVCMTPAKFAKKEDLQLKAEFFKTWPGTTHWPYCNIRKQDPPERDGKPDPQSNRAVGETGHHG